MRMTGLKNILSEKKANFPAEPKCHKTESVSACSLSNTSKHSHLYIMAHLPTPQQLLCPSGNSWAQICIDVTGNQKIRIDYNG